LGDRRTRDPPGLTRDLAAAKTRKRSRGAGAGDMARRADKYRLYERSVQCPEAELDFVRRVYKKWRGRAPRVLREDFCGTAAVAREWVRRNRAHTAVGIDREPAVLAWARRRGGEHERLLLLQSDVLQARRAPLADVLVAMNFSYWIFKERALLRRYFRRARPGLKPGGLFFLDAYGGSEAYTEMAEETRYPGFVYIWDQASYNPLDAGAVCHIHFRFPDGSLLKRAFSYDWRLWSLPEIQELLREAGFARVAVYWEGVGRNGKGNGIYRPVRRADADPAWIAYIVAGAG